MNVRKLVEWAKLDRDRVFEVRFIADVAHPWTVTLSNDSLGWAHSAEAHTTLGSAIDWALRGAEDEESTPVPAKRLMQISKTGIVSKVRPPALEPIMQAAEKEFGEP